MRIVKINLLGISGLVITRLLIFIVNQDYSPIRYQLATLSITNYLLFFLMIGISIYCAIKNIRIWKEAAGKTEIGIITFAVIYFGVAAYSGLMLILMYAFRNGINF